MSLFQESVLKNYLKQQDNKQVEKSYKKYVKYFHNPTIQQNIKDSKEEQFQEGFLRELFVNIFDYVLNPNPDFNLTTEYKNEKGAKKADGAILKEGNALAVIELKGTNIKDLESIRQQAFDYKANQTGCVYVITSNFEKLRFYINNAVEFEEFNLFTLNQEQFALMYLCLHKDNLLNNLALTINNDSLVQEEKITKKFYADYSLFKRELYRDLVKQNMKNEVFREELSKEDNEQASKKIKLKLFKKSQKLIDRFLFIFFAEDRGLLPPNSTLKVLEQWDKLKELDEIVPLYKRYLKYFNYLDTGRKGTDKVSEIFAYNGGLFQPDPILDSLNISDELLYKHTSTLANYDFESQVDVNILGHIFENSLNEIESVNAEIEGTEFDKQKTKRKKDGVFYTPKYITKYIVDNTVGKLCTEKKEELGIKEEDYFKSRKGRPVKTLKALQEKLETYRKWMLTLTILDPACGSGAFLNQALDFLIKEHRYLDELQASLLGGSIVFQNIESTILENNIYGVDLNEESVEIAKLSLWLRTAQPRRELNVLSNNIKCGNSLIDDKKVAGDKAFNWQEEFPEVFVNGGFDVVIGNPPYVRQELFKEFKPYLEDKFKSYQGTADLYVYFFELSIEHLLSKNGIYSIIVANKWMRSNYGKPLRKWMKNKEIVEIIDFGDLPVFADATAYPCIITLSPQNAKSSFRATIPTSLDFSDLNLLVASSSFSVNTNSLDDNGWSLVGRNISKLIEALKGKGQSLKQYAGSKIFYGIKTGLNEAFVIERKLKDEILNKNPNSKSLIKPFVAGRDIKRYLVDFQESYLILIPSGWTDQKRDNIEAWVYLKNEHPEIANHLFKYQDKLIKRTDQGAYWWELRACSYYEEFEKSKLLLPDISTRGNFVLDKDDNYYTVNTAYIIGGSDEFLLGVLNSKLITFYYRNISPAVRGGYLRFIYQYLIAIPIVEFEDFNKRKLFVSLISEMNGKKNTMQKISKNFLNYLQHQNPIESFSKKLQNWDELEFSEFIKELNKAIKKTGGQKLTKMDEMEWMEVFEAKKAEAQALKTEIDKTDKQIDQMVYELYGLSEEEIRIVEESVQ